MLSHKENEKRLQRARSIIGAVVEIGGRSHAVRRREGGIVLTCDVSSTFQEPEVRVFAECLINCPACATSIMGLDPSVLPTAAWDGVAHLATSTVLVRRERGLRYAEVLLRSETACRLTRLADTREIGLGQEQANCLACLGAL